MKNYKNLFSIFCKDWSGQAAIEYILLLVTIGGILVGVSRCIKN